MQVRLERFPKGSEFGNLVWQKQISAMHGMFKDGNGSKIGEWKLFGGLRNGE